MEKPEHEKIIKGMKVMLILMIIGGAGIGLGYYFYYNPIYQETRTPTRFFWMPSMANDSVQILYDHYDQINFLSPIWLNLLPNGSLINPKENSSEYLRMLEIQTFCQLKHIPIHPLVSCGNNSWVRTLVENASAQQAFINATNYYTNIYNWAGINIDFEGFDNDLREGFTLFLRTLRTNMNKSKILSIDLPALENEVLSEWGSWCNYTAIGQIVDMVMIMTYDNHGGWSNPGEVAPTSWVSKVMAYATRNIPMEKLYVGIPLYGYDWSTDEGWENWGFGYQFFQDRIAKYGGTPTRTLDGKELCYKYTDKDGYRHTAYFCDAETIRAKEKYLSRFPVAGYCYWHLSCGDPAYFD